MHEEWLCCGTNLTKHINPLHRWRVLRAHLVLKSGGTNLTKHINPLHRWRVILARKASPPSHANRLFSIYVL